VYFPEYSISNKILLNIANAEYAKAVIETTTILEEWQNQLEKKALIENITALLQFENYNFPTELVKKRVDLLADKSHVEVENMFKAIEYCSEALYRGDLEVEHIRDLHTTLAEKIQPDAGQLRNAVLQNGVPAQEILARLYDLLDWLYSKDAAETHQHIKALLFLHEYLKIQPFKKFNLSSGFLLFDMILDSKGSLFTKYLKLMPYFQQLISNEELFAKLDNEDLTEWLETGTHILASESFKIKDEILLLARDTKVAKASGFVKLTPRQKRIVAYLQDYGLLRNKDFATIFPDVSEDSVLRDLKNLINEDIVIKTGSTKSSSYVLK
jgi:hypothetical protein